MIRTIRNNKTVECSLKYMIGMMRCFGLLIVCFIFFSCSDNKAEQNTPAPPPPIYYFYPKANVYFDTVNRDYVFLGSDGKTWTAEKQIPAAMQSMMDKSILLDTFSQPVWKDNQNHRLIYSAVLYAVPEDTIEKKPLPIAEQKPADAEVDEKKEKKGLRKFLDKLFGKKKKDKEEKSQN